MNFLEIELNKKFLLVEGIIFSVLAVITLLEFFNFLLFTEFFMRMKEYLSWFLGLSIGPVISSQIYSIRRKINGKKGFIPPEQRFAFFLLNIVWITIAVGIVQSFFLSFLLRYFAFFHVIVLQWLVIVYVWFKSLNNFKIHTKYVIGAEILVLLFSLIITFSF
ncbi:MAG: hypothetical protein V1886_01185 [archaeon]